MWLNTANGHEFGADRFVTTVEWQCPPSRNGLRGFGVHAEPGEAVEQCSIIRSRSVNHGGVNVLILTIAFAVPLQPASKGRASR